MSCHPLFVLTTLATAVLLGIFATPHVPRWGGMKVMHAWSAVPQNWVSMGHPHRETTIDLHLALKSHRENALIDSLYEVSNPRHPKYGEYLSKEQVAELVAPHPETLDLVRSWLNHYEIPSSSISTTLGGNWLAVINVPVSKANKMLGASYQLYQHVETNDTVLRTISFSLPEALHGHIETVVPTTYFGSSLKKGMKRQMRPSKAAGARTHVGPGDSDELMTGLSSRDPAKQSVTPSFLHSLYKTAGYVPAAADRNRFGVGGYSGQYPSPDDLRTFMKKYRTDGQDATYTVEKVNGGDYDPSNPGVEANLDIQYSEAMAYPTPHIYYSTAGVRNTATDPFIKWLTYVLDQTNIPQTISTSYGDYEYTVPPAYARLICFLFAKLGSRGVSVLFPSGDTGVGHGPCTFTDGSGRTSDIFLPVFPATCPYVTSVGGTRGGTSEDDPEVAASLSGGGFSKYFPIPPYQGQAVSDFLDILGDNKKGRGYPDISAQAVDFEIILNGEPQTKSGTSASTPVRHSLFPLRPPPVSAQVTTSTQTVAGVISLLNDRLISKGQPALGFLNPRLYDELRTGFNDITSGSNPGCGTDGFSAIVGWDPVTGLGTPDFAKLMKIIDDRPSSSGAGPSNPSSEPPTTTTTAQAKRDYVCTTYSL
ncbi:peptidase S8/S53 domain-containing protein [Lactarius quietus]|nr:peptidase S8/S53 domain-containing protein [Lactarius quietus]